MCEHLRGQIERTRAHVPRRLGLSRALACIVHSTIHEVRKGLLLVCEHLRGQIERTRAHVPRRLGLSRALACIVHSIIHEVRKGLLLVCEYLRSQGIGKVQNLLCEFFSR